MNDAVRALEPKSLWNHFADLNAIPRPSKREEKVIAFMKQFGEGLGLSTVVDDAGNVIIKKPASPGMEDRTPIILQAHLDMVHQKNNETDFDFDRQGIRMIVDGDWVKAEGTTLGADNGLGVAAIMTLLASKDISHPPLEGLFTIDEETGMTGAEALKSGVLEGKMLLNLDTEDDDEVTIGCAGGIDITAESKVATTATPKGMKGYTITVKGLTGGHSGMDIHLGRANANKLMNRLLWMAAREHGLRVSKIDGGGLRNAIPRESMAEVVIAEDRQASFEKDMEQWKNIFKAEYKTTDPDLSIVLKPGNAAPNVLEEDVQRSLLNAIYACPNGIYRLSPDIEDLVQTSNNLARVWVADGECKILCLTRSAVDTEKMDLAQAIQANFEQMGAVVTLSGSYPGWTPNPEATVVHLVADTYKELFQENPKVLACHAGLECGILGNAYPNVEMVSFGPNIKGAHSPDERTQISSVQKFWKLLLEILQRVPKAA